MSRLATLQSVDTTWEEDDDIDDNDNDNDENVVLATSALKESQEVTMPATLEPDWLEIAGCYTSHATTTDSSSSTRLIVVRITWKLQNSITTLIVSNFDFDHMKSKFVEGI